MRYSGYFATAAVWAIVFSFSIGLRATAQRAGSVAMPTAETAAAADAVDKPVKQVLIPERGTRAPEGNDYNDPESEFCYQRSKETENFVLFWAKEYGNDPMANEDTRRRFNVDDILSESERFFDYYVHTLKWVDKEKSFAAQYKFLIYIIGGTGGTAFGGSIDNKIGAFWSPATRVNRGPYGVVAHELGHSFQAIGRADVGGGRFSGGSIGEMGAQYMLWQVYPEWMTFENYHLNDFMRATHLAFLHPENQYHSCYPIEYWSNKHGVELFGRMWREVQQGEDPVMTYKRLTEINQEQFNDEMFDACRRFVTWDMPRIEQVAARYANQHTTTLNGADEGWFQIAAAKCPQNYGYNAIQLKVPAAETKVGLQFKGLAGAEGFSNAQLEKAGWRYGFLASKEDGGRVYSDVFSNPDGSVEFTVPGETKFLWLVVMGAPSEHWVHVSARGGGRGRGRGRGRRGGADAAATPDANATANANAVAAVNTTEQWPYRIKLSGTGPVDSIVE